jgi:hypothetical protein
MEEVAVRRRMEDSESADPIGKVFMDLISRDSCLEGVRFLQENPFYYPRRGIQKYLKNIIGYKIAYFGR